MPVIKLAEVTFAQTTYYRGKTLDRLASDPSAGLWVTLDTDAQLVDIGFGEFVPMSALRKFRVFVPVEEPPKVSVSDTQPSKPVKSTKPPSTKSK